MAVVLNLDEGTTRQLCCSENFQRRPYPSFVRELPKLLNNLIFRSDSVLKLLMIGTMVVDPLVFYVPVISNDKKCIKLDQNLGIVACAYLTIFDLFYIIFFSRHRFFQLYDGFLNDARKFFGLLIEVLIILPIPQVMVYFIIVQKMRSWTIWMAQFVLILHHVPRCFIVFKWNITRISASFPEWTSMFFTLYIIFSQLYGGLWYNGSIYTETECWRKACKNHTGCSNDIFYCDHDSSEDYTIINDYCSINTTKYDFGIFLAARDLPGMLNVTESLQLNLFCFRWGLQHLGSFGQNIQPGTEVLGNLFVIALILTGVGLFFFLVGKVQLSLQYDTERFGKMKQKLKETEQWFPFKKLSKDLQLQLKKHKQYVKEETRGANIESMFCNLTEDLRRKMNHELCLKLLKKVEEFGRWSEESTKKLCDCIKPVLYGERTRVIREGDPIDEMIFVVQGMLWTYTSRGTTTGTSSSDHRNRRNEHLKDEDFCGKELVEWLQADPYISDLPISTRTIQAVTNVEAFVLMAYDLKKIFKKRHEAALFIQLYWRFRRVSRLRRNAQTTAQEANTTSTTQSQQ